MSLCPLCLLLLLLNTHGLRRSSVAHGKVKDGATFSLDLSMIGS